MRRLPRAVETAVLVPPGTPADTGGHALMSVRFERHPDEPDRWTVHVAETTGERRKATHDYTSEADARVALSAVYRLGEATGNEWRVTRFDTH